MAESYYDLLGVPEDATTAEIEAAYRERVKDVHPDLSERADAMERTQRLNRAKAVLTDEAERARYDRLGHEAYAGTDGEATERGTGAGTGAGTGTGPTGDDGTGDASARGSDGAAADPGATGGSGRGTGADRTASAAGGSGRGARRSAGSERVSGDSTVSGRGVSTSGGHSTAGGSTAARRQAAAARDADRVYESWNSWESRRNWSVREGSGGRGFDPTVLVPDQQGAVTALATFFLYPIFVASSVLPFFPLALNLLVGVCTLAVVAYLVSVPELGVLVFGAWSLLAPLLLVALPGVGLVSVVGLLALVATWVPFGFAALLFSFVHL